jgi:hypothetical protein
MNVYSPAHIPQSNAQRTGERTEIGNLGLIDRWGLDREYGLFISLLQLYGTIHVEAVSRRLY